jgi:hypothetical protein
MNTATLPSKNQRGGPIYGKWRVTGIRSFYDMAGLEYNPPPFPLPFSFQERTRLGMWDGFSNRPGAQGRFEKPSHK